MEEEEKKSLKTIIRDRFTIAKYICNEESGRKSFADGYFKGWFDATTIILNAIDRTDLLNRDGSAQKAADIAKMGNEAISETEAGDLLETIRSLFHSS